LSDARVFKIRKLRRDERRKGVLLDGVDYWFEVSLPTEQVLQVPVFISGTNRATGVGQPLTEKDFEAIAHLRLQETIDEGKLPVDQLSPDKYDALFDICNIRFGDLARRVK
jgi:hypothetical protein